MTISTYKTRQHRRAQLRDAILFGVLASLALAPALLILSLPLWFVR